MGSMSETNNGSYYIGRDRKIHYFKSFLCFIRQGKTERFHIDGFRKKVALDYTVPMGTIFPYISEDIYIRKLVIEPYKTKYALKCNGATIPLIPVNGTWLNIRLTDTLVNSRRETITDHLGPYDFYGEPLNYLVDNEPRGIQLINSWEKDKFPRMCHIEGNTEAEEALEAFIHNSLYEILARARDTFLSEIDSGLHFLINGEDYMLPRSEDYFRRVSA